jgi:lysyl-tRNA synthetase class II
MWEQSLGRLRRAGQPADVVRTWFHMHTRELRRRVRNALRAAYYVVGTTPMQQQILGGFADEVFETLDETADDDGDAE